MSVDAQRPEEEGFPGAGMIGGWLYVAWYGFGGLDSGPLKEQCVFLVPNLASSL